MLGHDDEYIPLDADVAAERGRDPHQKVARDELFKFFQEHREQVFYSRQIEVIREDRHFH